jgi:hypothetical protein
MKQAWLCACGCRHAATAALVDSVVCVYCTWSSTAVTHRPVCVLGWDLWGLIRQRNPCLVSQLATTYVHLGHGRLHRTHPSSCKLTCKLSPPQLLHNRQRCQSNVSSNLRDWARTKVALPQKPLPHWEESRFTLGPAHPVLYCTYL